MKKTALMAALLSTGFLIPAAASTFFVVTPILKKSNGDSEVSVALSGASLPRAYVGVPYEANLSTYASLRGASPGARIVWSILSGALPNGLTLDPTTGVLSGTPTEASPLTQLNVRATVQQASGEAAFAIDSYVAAQVSLLQATLPQANEGVPYNYSMSALTTLIGSEPGASLSWSIKSGQLPSGLVLNAATGTISGTPTSIKNATATFDVEVRYSIAGSTTTYSIPVKASMKLLFTSLELPVPEFNPMDPPHMRPMYSVDLNTYVERVNLDANLSASWQAIGRLPDGWFVSSEGVLQADPFSLESLNPLSLPLRVTVNSVSADGIFVVPYEAVPYLSSTYSVKVPITDFVKKVQWDSQPGIVVNNYGKPINPDNFSMNSAVFGNNTVLPPGLRIAGTTVVGSVSRNVAPSNYTTDLVTSFRYMDDKSSEMKVISTTNQVTFDTSNRVDTSKLYDIVAAAGTDYSDCFLSAAGDVYCEGNNTNGATGQVAGITSNYVPVKVELGAPAAAIFGNPAAMCAVLTDARAKCWGYLPNATGGGTRQYTPVEVGGALAGRISKVVVAESHACLLATDGTVHCWGGNSSGQLGTGSSATVSTTPVQIPNITATDIASRAKTTCVLSPAGGVSCWGYAFRNGLGNPSISAGTIVRSPVTPIGMGSGVSKLFGIRSDAYCVLKGTVPYCWGSVGGAGGKAFTSPDVFSANHQNVTQMLDINEGLCLLNAGAWSCGYATMYPLKHTVKRMMANNGNPIMIMADDSVAYFKYSSSSAAQTLVIPKASLVLDY